METGRDWIKRNPKQNYRTYKTKLMEVSCGRQTKLKSNGI